MPYIHSELRECVEDYELMPPEDGATLNYVVCRLVARFVEYHGLRYSVISQARDALNGANNEFERCVVGPYEQRKRRENGDVWGLLPALAMGDSVDTSC